jgi:hypothetical protein
MQVNAKQSLLRVVANIELTGNLHIPRNAIATKDKPRALAIEAKSMIDYEERLPSGDSMIVDRYYHQATSDAMVLGNKRKLALRDEVRRIAVEPTESRLRLTAFEDHLRHDELDLLELPINGLALEQILTDTEVKAGTTWRPEPTALAMLFDLDAVHSSTIQVEVVSVESSAVKMQIHGQVEAAVDAVPTSIELAAKATFDPSKGIMTWFAAAISEKREIGRGEPGFQLSARIRLQRESLQEPIGLTTPTPSVPSPRLIEIHSEDSQYVMLCDPRWRVMGDAGGWTMLRLVERDEVLAQCEITKLAPRPADKPITIEGLKEDVQRSLGEAFQEFIVAETIPNTAPLQVFRLVAAGSVQGIAVQWIYLHTAHDDGRRHSIVYTLDAKNAEMVVAAESQMTASLRLLDTPLPSIPPAVAAKPATTAATK